MSTRQGHDDDNAPTQEFLAAEPADPTGSQPPEPELTRPARMSRHGAAAGAAAPLLSDGEIVDGRYRVERLLAQGGMGQVYQAEDLFLQERVALKTLRPELLREQSWQARFRREIQIARKVTHRNVCRIFEVGFHQRDAGVVPFLSMELLVGKTLAEWLAERDRLTPGETLPLLDQLCAGLQAAHDVGIVHRDFKPQNVILVEPARSPGPALTTTPPEPPTVRAVITDFGIACATSALRIEQPAQRNTDILGTPAYMAPEQVLGSELTPAVDIYALGVVLYEMLSGELPFVGDTPMSQAVMRVGHAAVPLGQRVPGLDPLWEQVIMRCLLRHPGQRFAAARDVALVLRPPPQTAGATTPERLSLGHTESPHGELRASLQRPDARYNPLWYICRERAEKDALAYLDDPGIPACLWGPERFGKTWLLEHLLALFEQRHAGQATLVRINLHSVSDEQRESFDTFLRAFAGQLVDDESNADTLIERAWSVPGAAPNDKLRRLMRERLRDKTHPVVVAIDNADSILGQPYSDSFFGMLRAWAENTRPPWTQLRLLLAVSTTPLRLTESLHNSPFRNLSEPIELDELDADQLSELAARHGLAWGPSEIAALMDLVGGHPYLARVAMYQAAQHEVPLTTLLAADKGGGPFDDHVRKCRSFLRSRPSLAEALRAIARAQAADGTPPPQLDPDDFEGLRRAGFIVQRDGLLRLRCRLYAMLASAAP